MRTKISLACSMFKFNYPRKPEAYPSLEIGYLLGIMETCRKETEERKTINTLFELSLSFPVLSIEGGEKQEWGIYV